MATEFPKDIASIRERARQQVESGTATTGYRGDLQAVLRMLDEALATEIVSVLRYRRHYYMAGGIHARAVAAEFLEHANEEQGHADRIAARIVQLGGSPDLNPGTLLRRSHAEYVEGNGLRSMVRENLVAERIAILCYGEMIRDIGDTDPTTRRLLEAILADEEEHAEDLANVLGSRRRPRKAAARPPATLASLPLQ